MSLMQTGTNSALGTSVRETLAVSDILQHIFSHLFLANDYLSILSCSFVNKAFNACSKIYLYHRVACIGDGTQKTSPRFRLPSSGQTTLQINAECHFRSSLLPEHASYVKRLYVSGSDVSRACEAIQAFPSLHTLSLKPYPSANVKTLLGFLANAPRAVCSTLRVLEVWDACFVDPEYGMPFGMAGVQSIVEEDEDTVGQNTPQQERTNAELLMDIVPLVLDSLVIHNPKTVLLSNLPAWLGKLQASGTLRNVSLIENAGPVTPALLSSLVPAFRAIDLQKLELGISYSLTDTNIFTALNELPQLQELTLAYYLQLSKPSVTPSLPKLRILRVVHTGPPICTAREATFFSKFVRRIIHDSPLEELELRKEHYEHRTGLRITCLRPSQMPALLKAHRDPCPSLSSLLSHLATARHGLRVLRIIDFSAKVRDLARLCKARGSRLEQLEVGLAGVTSIKLLPQLVAPLAKLKQLHVRVNGVTRKRLGMLLGQGDQVPETLTIDDLVQRLPGDLGWLGINNREWEITWRPSHVEESATRPPSRVVAEMGRHEVLWE